jgi:Eco57I restriction-modification methylase/N-6 DNA Methylase
MNRTALKNYAPQARRAFIQAITDRAAYYGLTPNKIEPVVQKGDVAVIGGREHPRVVAGTRKQLEERIKRYGFEPAMEAIAYTWFNRLVAIRFMELHGYLEHGYRVLSHPEGKLTPEIMEKAEHVALAGLKHNVVIDLKLAGNKEGELYRLLLTAQCNALHAAMPFLFERIDDETELLLPDNLLHSDSLIRKLVSEIDEQDWQQVEIIGWLYQFYISERKDEVIGEVVASQDIPAATQLFTPNWIVKYLVQNTLGRQWLATYPSSPLRQKMEYYIEPAEQTPDVEQQLKIITPTSLNPEELTLLDPACGSGHILVEAYDLFKAIYQERGYRAKDIPALILQKNLFGLEIDDRAAQLAAFALTMKARADDRRIFDSYAKPNILAFQDSQEMNASDITHALNSPISKDDVPSEYLFEEIQEDKDGLFSKKELAEKGHVSRADIVSLLDLFENAKTFGSLIRVPSQLAVRLPSIESRLDDVSKHGNLTNAPAHVIKPLLHQARLLTGQYDAVVANPPYMGGKYFTGKLKTFVADQYKDAKADLYACFIQRNLSLAKPNKFVGMITIPNWMFLTDFKNVRKAILEHHDFATVIWPQPAD